MLKRCALFLLLLVPLGLLAWWQVTVVDPKIRPFSQPDGTVIFLIFLIVDTLAFLVLLKALLGNESLGLGSGYSPADDSYERWGSGQE